MNTLGIIITAIIVSAAILTLIFFLTKKDKVDKNSHLGGGGRKTTHKQ